ncbi:putative ribosomal protein S30 [Helianthus debilis subsp. tardiflorus]
MCMNLIRGKVHGSMACAGKVRGQTPTVAKQDKKQPCGRAHKHIQYNRHFVTSGKVYGSLVRVSKVRGGTPRLPGRTRSSSLADALTSLSSTTAVLSQPVTIIEKKLTMMVIPSLFMPKDWSSTFLRD